MGIKKRLLISLMSLLILTAILASFACNSEKTAETTPTPTPTPQETPVVHENSMGYAIEAFQRFPIEWGNARYIDLAAFRQDAKLAPSYAETKALVTQGLSSIGIDMDQINHVSFVPTRAAVYSGNLIIADVRQILANGNYTQSTYLDVEIWQSPDQGNVVTLLPSNSVLVTKNLEDAELFISVIRGWADSLYDNESLKGLIARLPQDPVRVDISVGGDGGLLSTVTSIEKTGNLTLEMLSITEFSDEASAEKGFTDVSSDFNSKANSWNLVNVETIQIRSFIKSTGEVNIANIGKGATPLGYKPYWLY